MSEDPTSPDRPRFVSVFCIGWAIYALGITAANLFHVRTSRDSLIDGLFASIPAAILCLCLWGLWRMRWLGLIACVAFFLLGEVLIYLFPGGVQAQGLAASTLTLAVLAGFAYAYRQQFR